MTRFGDAPIDPKPVVHKAVVHKAVASKRKPGIYADPDKRRAYKTAWQAKARASRKPGEMP
jgi:hypothetical protein